ncbi:aspartate racemase [Gillisia sp. Hel1_33_143]|uniref:aspartate/glutamate racemase family protein n=1 Tax=Gillisia sp. Hel1_33_143 TaxID=1336796 RepID=UPI000879536E|nr:amino acid racemase [Gillisia sp. Hel1_33_143]SDR78501.1 aspartate racemase [Gillisia sp. Hel1_33_143]
MKLLGLIGGTSYHSTMVYYRMINEMVGKVIGSQANPPLLIYSLNIELMRAQDIDKINLEYLNIAKKLESAGAKAIVICANTPHMAYDFVQPKISIPILHIADAIGIEAERLGLKTLGLLGNKPTMTKGFISSTLKKRYNIETIIPEPIRIQEAHNFVSNELTQGIFSETAKGFFTNQMKLLKKRGAEGIILGCTELPILFENTHFKLPLLATTDLHAQMATDFILGSYEPNL